jgi:hypothetical protein
MITSNDTNSHNFPKDKYLTLISAEGFEVQTCVSWLTQPSKMYRGWHNQQKCAQNNDGWHNRCKRIETTIFRTCGNETIDTTYMLVGTTKKEHWKTN